MKIQKQAFTLVEIIVAIVVFLIGISGIYAIMQSTMYMNTYNKNYIIATNLAREQIELVRNIRDTNVARTQAYNVLKPLTQDFDKEEELIKKIEPWTYTITNNLSGDSSKELVDMEKKTKLTDEKDLSQMSDYKVCRDKNTELYDYCGNISNSDDRIPTPFYKFIKIEEIKDKWGNAIDGFKATSKVVWKGRTVHSFDIKAIFTDNQIY